MTLDTLCLTFWSMLCTFAILCSPRRRQRPFCAAVGQRGHLHPLGTGQRFADGAAGLRFLIALVAPAPLAIVRRRWLPAPGTRLQTAATGLMLIGGYSVCYFEAMANGVTPGLIATIMGIQPILTLCVVERRLQGGGCQGC